MPIVKSKNCEGAVPPKKKQRRCVTWTPEEDDLLREETRIHGTEKWRIIADKFKGKTARQCRRRFINLKSEFKKGSWSPEEDLLLCEAHKEFGNKWTEIAKMVTGRTDNAVKNRFSTLCKKRARLEAFDKENTDTYTNTNNKRPISNSNVFHSQGSLRVAPPHKKIRFAHAPDLLENDNIGSASDKDCMIGEQQSRPPFEVLAQTGDEIDTQHSQHQVTIQEALIGGDVKVEGFSKKDGPKILALKQRAELLSSLAVKITENMDNGLENVCKVIDDLFCDSKDGEAPNCSISDMNLHLDQLKELVDMKCCNTENQPSQRQPGLYDSPSSSEDFLCDSKDGDAPNCSISDEDLHLDQLKDLVDMKCSYTENQPSQRQPGLYDSPSSLEDFLCDSEDDEAPNCSIADLDLHFDQLKDLVDMKCCNTENQPSQGQPGLNDSPSSSEDFLCDSKDGEAPNCSISDVNLHLDQLKELVDMKCCNTENQPSQMQPGLNDSSSSSEDFLCDSKDGEAPNCSISDVNLHLDQLKDLVDMKCCITENQPSQRQPGLYDSLSSLEDFLCDSKDGEAPNCSISDVDLHLDQLKDLVDMKCCITENQPSQGQPGLNDSPSSSEDFLCDSKDGVAPNCSISNEDLHHDQLKDLVDMKCSYTENQPSQRQPSLYDSPNSSEYSKAPTILSTNTSEQIEQTQSEMCGLSDDAGTRLQNIVTRDEIVLLLAEANNDGDVSALADTSFSSPQVTPSFSSLRVTQSYSSLRATIPSPEFSDSERHYLIERMELRSRTTNRINPSHPPPCRRALVHSL